jgi:hypothetical protein
VTTLHQADGQLLMGTSIAASCAMTASLQLHSRFPSQLAVAAFRFSKQLGTIMAMTISLLRDLKFLGV